MNTYHLFYNLIDQSGNKIPFTLPYCWEGVSFRQMEKLWELNGLEQHMDESYLIEIFTGIARNTWNKCDDIQLLFAVNNTLAFLSDLTKVTDQVKDPSHKFEYNGRVYEIPKDIAVKSIGQYKDLMKFCIEPFLDEAGDFVSKCKTIPLMIAIYMQPLMGVTINDFVAGRYADYDFEKAKELSEQMKDISIIDALRIQSFFFRKSLELKKDFQG